MVRPACYLAFGFALLAWAALRPTPRAAADQVEQLEGAMPAAVAPAGVRVQVEKTDGTLIDGTLHVPTLRIETAHGTLDLTVARVKAIQFADEPDGVAAIVELDDHTQIRGKALFDALRVTTAAGVVERLAPGDLRKLTVLREADMSVVALALGLIALTAMEIVLGIDNVIVLAIIVSRLPKERQPQARRLGLAAALGTRILLLFFLTWLLGLNEPLFTLPIPGVGPGVREVSGRDIILFLGGAFLIYKSVKEMHGKLEEVREKTPAGEAAPVRPAASFAGVIAQIAVIDIVFSLDSVITAVGMVDVVWVMVTAMVIAMLVMLAFAGPISNFVDRHPTVKMLALSFLILIGVLLVAEGLDQHISKGYIYFAMAFAVAMEMVNMRLRPRPAEAAGMTNAPPMPHQ